MPGTRGNGVPIGSRLQKAQERFYNNQKLSQAQAEELIKNQRQAIQNLQDQVKERDASLAILKQAAEEVGSDYLKRIETLEIDVKYERKVNNIHMKHIGDLKEHIGDCKKTNDILVADASADTLKQMLEVMDGTDMDGRSRLTGESEVQPGDSTNNEGGVGVVTSKDVSSDDQSDGASSLSEEAPTASCAVDVGVDVATSNTAATVLETRPDCIPQVKLRGRGHRQGMATYRRCERRGAEIVVS